MTSKAVIDLLSTDDETLIEPKVAKSKRATEKLQTRPDSMFLSDPLDIEDLPKENWSESAPKRRRLSRSPPLQTITTSKRSALSTSQPLDTISHNRNGSGRSDDINFSSSAGISRSTLRTSQRFTLHALNEESDGDLPDDILSLENASLVPQDFNKTASFLAKIREKQAYTLSRKNAAIRGPTINKKAQPTSVSPRSTQDNFSNDDDNQDVQKPRNNPKKKPKLTEQEKALKAQEKEAEKEARAVQKAKDKEAEKEKRRLEGEEKAREKQRVADLAEVNKVKKDRKETCKEMIVDLPTSIEGTRVDDQIKEFLKNQQIAITSYQSPVPNVIRWRRKVDSQFDQEQGHRIAIPKEIREEEHALCLMSAKEFVELATADANQLENETLDGHIQNLKRKFTRCAVIYVIEGLDVWMRKNKNARNRAYQAAVLGQAQVPDDNLPTSSQQKYRRKRQPDIPVDMDMIEDALLRLQVIEECLIHHTTTSFDSAEWVANFTQHISQLPYR